MSNADVKVVSTDDEALRSAMRSGDESAMGVLYDRYSGVVYSVALRVRDDTAAAEDILQDIFIQLWRNPARFNSNRGSIGPWLAVIARNRAIDVLRKLRPEDDIADVAVSINRRELELLRGDAALAYSAAHSAPPRRSRQRLMDAVQREPRRKEVPAKRSWWAAVPWFAAAAMTILAVLLMRQNTRA